MADSKSAGLMAVRVRLPLRVPGSSSRVGLLSVTSVASVSDVTHFKCGERALFGCGCYQVPHFSLQDGCCGEGRHVLFHVCGWCRCLWGSRPSGVAGVIIGYWLGPASF